MVENLADSGNTGQIRYLYRGNFILECIVVLLWIQEAEFTVITTLGWELVHTLCCVPYRESGNCRAIISVITRIS
jgi:hypothetical protein